MSTKKKILRALEPRESRGGRPGLPVPNSPYGLSGRKATLNFKKKETAEKQQQQQKLQVWFSCPLKSVTLILWTVFEEILLDLFPPYTRLHNGSRRLPS